MASILDMKIEQLAFGVALKLDWDVHAERAKTIDRVVFDGRFRTTHDHPWFQITNVIGYLAFTYDQGVELEYLHYPNPDNTFHSLIWGHQEQINYLSHVGAHVDNIDTWMNEDLMDNGSESIVNNLIMDVTTKSHSNPYLVENGRTYRYAIFDCRATHGFFWKLIQRINRAPILDRNI